MSKRDEEVRALIKKRLLDGTLSAQVMLAEAALRDAPAVEGERRAMGLSCACWRGKLCQYHNLMYHGEGQ